MTGVIGIPYKKHTPHVYHVADQSEPQGWSRMRWGIYRMKHNAIWNTVEPLYNEHA